MGFLNFLFIYLFIYYFIYLFIILFIYLLGGAILEICHQITTVVFDKTGTLTHGKPVVTDYKIFSPNFTTRQFFFFVGSAELGSEHVIGKAIVKHVKDEKICELSQPSEFTVSDGRTRGRRHVIFISRTRKILSIFFD